MDQNKTHMKKITVTAAAVAVERVVVYSCNTAAREVWQKECQLVNISTTVTPKNFTVTLHCYLSDGLHRSSRHAADNTTGLRAKRKLESNWKIRNNSSSSMK